MKCIIVRHRVHTTPNSS